MAALGFVGCTPDATPKPTPVDREEREQAKLEARRQRELKVERAPAPRDPNRVVPVVTPKKLTTCSTDADCGEGNQCTYNGCQGAGVCAKTRDCGTEVTYCGCDGKDFKAPLSCPGKAYDHRGTCAGPGPNYRK